MDKITMAHEYAMAFIREALRGDIESDFNYNLIALNSWSYADAMHEQLDKRESKGVPKDVLNRCNSTKLEWQPDWSQAPAGLYWFAIDGVGAFWYRNMPTWDGEEWSDYKDDREGSSTEPTMPFGYKGKYIDSLRKRPD